MDKKSIQGKHMQALYDILSAEGVEEVFELMQKMIIDRGHSGTGRNVTFINIENGIATMQLDQSVFGNDIEPFKTDEKQFKYMIKEFNHLMKKEVPAIIITRDDTGLISVFEPNVA